MELQVLISSLFNDKSIIEKSNLSKEKVIVVNQCDVKVEKREHLNDKHLFISSPGRGLSRSRNLAISASTSDICLIADDDECFIENLSETICSEYEKNSDADIIVFKMSNVPTKLGTKSRRLKKIELMRVYSWQISFRRELIQDHILFDVLLGSGTGNGASEENKFLLDCYNSKYKIYYVPISIAQMNQSESEWFKGFTKDYFVKRGATMRYIYGFWFALLYCFFFSLTKHKLYKKDMSFLSSFNYMLYGVRKDLITKQKKAQQTND